MAKAVKTQVAKKEYTHLWRLDENGKPLTKSFTDEHFKTIPRASHKGELIPNGGWVLGTKIPKVTKPVEAMNQDERALRAKETELAEREARLEAREKELAEAEAQATDETNTAATDTKEPTPPGKVPAESQK